MSGKEALCSGKTLRGYKNVSLPAQDERTPPFTANPVADLISYHGPEYAKQYCIP
jgi:hypothetical protein